MRKINLNLKLLVDKRKEKGINTYEMADLLGINRSTLYFYEENKRTMSIDLFLKYITVLGYKKSDLPLFFAEIVAKKQHKEKLKWI